MNTSAGKPKAQSGLSLVELMVALLISTLLLLGVLELFGSSSQTQRSANAIARLQENGRLAMDLIAREARRTGFYGCDSLHGNNGEEDFGDGGKIDSFPAESLKGSTENSLTFRYFGGKNGGGVTAAACSHNDLKNYYVSFKNCKDEEKNNICIQSTDTGKTPQTLLDNGSIKEVLYIQPCRDDANKTCSYKAAELPRLNATDASFAAVTKLQVTIMLCADEKSENSAGYCSGNSKTKIERTFSSLIELRNRL